LSFWYEEIGRRLKAFRLGSDLSIDEIARQIGISRTALYRFEKGKLAKIETLEKVATLLNVSVPTLLGIGTEYIASAVSYFERLRQIEETASHIVALAGPIPFLLGSEEFESGLPEVLRESIPENVAGRRRALADVSAIVEILHQRKKLYLQRRPSVVSILSAIEIQRFLTNGFVGNSTLSGPILRHRRAVARRVIQHFASIIESPPMGVQVGIVPDTLPHAGFQIFSRPGRPILTISPFRLGEQPNIRVGVAMITSAPEALALHEKAVNEMWRLALKGETATRLLRKMVG
jgi:transcriptional regulator with XRE-family HTH domain